LSTQRGFTTIQYVVAAGFSMVLFVLTANLLVDLYERGAVRDALDEGVRSAVPSAAVVEACEQRASEVVAAIAGGGMIDVEALQCRLDGAWVVATADVRLRSWVPMILPGWTLHLRAAARREQ
jgi:hypothetical protein